MKDQHEKISGYRDLTEEEVALMNEIKEKGTELEKLIAKVTVRCRRFPEDTGTASDPSRYISIARTDIQTGFMWLIRAVAQPRTFS